MVVLVRCSTVLQRGRFDPVLLILVSVHFYSKADPRSNSRLACCKVPSISVNSSGGSLWYVAVPFLECGRFGPVWLILDRSDAFYP